MYSETITSRTSDDPKGVYFSVKTFRKALSAVMAAALIIGAAGCNGASDGGIPTERTTAADSGSADTPAVTTTTMDPNKEIDINPDYEEIADIGKVDTANESGAGKL